jgi:hypothetical protein
MAKKTISAGEAAKRDLLRDIECYTCGEPPSALLMLRAPIIENWSTEVRRRGKEFIMVVRGENMRHPEFQDGSPISTSAIMWFDRKCKFVRTTTRVYALGEPEEREIPVEEE